MGEYEDRERFIPLQRSEVVNLICEDGFFHEDEKKKFKEFALLLQSILHFEFQNKIEKLKDLYYPFDPDPTTTSRKQYSARESENMGIQFGEKFSELLNDANFDKLTDEDIDYAFKVDSPIAVKVDANTDDFKELLLFKRGEYTTTIEIPYFFSFLKKNIELEVFSNLVLLMKFRADYEPTKTLTVEPPDPDKIYLKTFRNVPKADLEMLFPNSKVRMKLKDKLKVTIPTVIGLGLVGSKIFNIAGGGVSTIVLGSVIIGLIGYIFKSYLSYKNAVLKYVTALSQGLYFKSIDNNSGVFYHIVNEAEEEEGKEALLSYYFLLKSRKPAKDTDIDDEVEKWIENKYNIKLDFEISDALSKLQRLELAEKTEKDLWVAKDLDASLRHLDYVWDNYFKYNI